MRQQFSPRSLEGTEIGGAVALLPKLARGCVITLNFDRVLETVFERAGVGFEQVVPGAAIVAAYQNALTLNRRYLLKVHGDVEDATNRVLTLREYRRSYGTGTKPAALLLLLQRAATLGRLLFIGCSLNKDRFMKALRAARKATPGLRCGFAIVQKPRNPPAFARRVAFLSAHGITPIWYAEGQYEDVAVVLDWLLERVQGSSSGSRRMGRDRGQGGSAAARLYARVRRPERRDGGAGWISGVAIPHAAAGGRTGGIRQDRIDGDVAGAEEGGGRARGLSLLQPEIGPYDGPRRVPESGAANPGTGTRCSGRISRRQQRTKPARGTL